MSYVFEKFSAARRALMLPHSQGEAQSIAMAFHECHLGLMEFDDGKSKEYNRELLQKLRQFMDTSAVPDEPERGKWFAKAEKFTNDEKIAISHIIDELAFSFADEE